METRGTWAPRLRSVQWRGRPPSRDELKNMMPIPANVQQLEAAWKYFMTGNVRRENHVAIEKARVETAHEHKERAKLSSWNKMHRVEKERLICGMVRAWRKKAGVYFD